MNYIASIITDQGPCMSINEDSSILRHESWNGHQVIFAAVCDGVGGLRLGEAASGSIIHQLDEDFIKIRQSYLKKSSKHPGKANLETIADKLKESLELSNVRLRNYGDGAGLRLGSTCSCMFIFDDEYIIIHVGDSKVFEIGEASRQLTKNHSINNLLTQCIGVHSNLNPDIIYGRSNSSIYLICSDGLTNTLELEEIPQIIDLRRIEKISLISESLELPAILSEEQVRTICTDLVLQARLRGEVDNISLIMIVPVKEKKYSLSDREAG